MLSTDYIEAACVKCHSAAGIPGASRLVRGARLFAEQGCIGCHKLKGFGLAIGPELDRTGFKRSPEWLVAYLNSRRTLRAFSRPETFDTNMVVIGAGSAGLVTALIAATVKAKVSLIERHKMGGDCLNTGCVPSKALIRSARIADYARRDC